MEATASAETPARADRLPSPPDAPAAAADAPRMIRCARCVAENPARMNFCRNCGAALAGASPDAPALRPAVASGAGGPGPAPRAGAATSAAAPDQDRAAPRRSCPHCHAKTPAGFSFCQRCGKHLPSVSEAVRTGALISGETGGRPGASSPALAPVPSPTPPGGMRVIPAVAAPNAPPIGPNAATIVAPSAAPDAAPDAAPNAMTGAARSTMSNVVPGVAPGAAPGAAPPMVANAAAPGQPASMSAAAPAPMPAAPSPRAVPWGSLVTLNPDGSEGIRHALTGAWVAIGRTHGDVLFADDRFLAPTHARIEHDGGRAHIVPLDTLNGVYRRLRQPAPLPHGATVLVGREMLRFELVDEDERDARPLVRHGVALFGSPAREPWGRLVQIMATGGIQDVRHLWVPVVTIGREEGDLVFRDDAFLSRRHAALSWRDGRCMIEDLDSANGTFLRLSGRSELRPDDFLRMGDQLFRVELAAAP